MFRKQPAIWLVMQLSDGKHGRGLTFSHVQVNRTYISIISTNIPIIRKTHPSMIQDHLMVRKWLMFLIISTLRTVKQRKAIWKFRMPWLLTGQISLNTERRMVMECPNGQSIPKKIRSLCISSKNPIQARFQVPSRSKYWMVTSSGDALPKVRPGLNNYHSNLYNNHYLNF